ncbi:hypothetical protein AAFF_G00043100 [Aldrovandia affinis]|uniref:Uncharacterized protein n=1 Tax=Aldrovandia affinis TaxID=143900 RepID=A0AAD7WFI6_9TELE|nr:hypothetical protein AAFF_G00043100 [Aldrovandia affinis]
MIPPHAVLPQSQYMTRPNQHQCPHRLVQWVQFPFQAHPAYTVPQYVRAVPPPQGVPFKDGLPPTFIPLIPTAPLTGGVLNVMVQGTPLSPHQLQATCVPLHRSYARFAFPVFPGMSVRNTPGLLLQTGSQIHLAAPATPPALAPAVSGLADSPRDVRARVSELSNGLPTSPSPQAFWDGPTFAFPEMSSLDEALRIFQCNPEADVSQGSMAEDWSGTVLGPRGGPGPQTQELMQEDVDWAASVQRLLAAQTPDRSVPSAEDTAMDFFGDMENYGQLLDCQLFGESMQLNEDSLENSLPFTLLW